MKHSGERQRASPEYFYPSSTQPHIPSERLGEGGCLQIPEFVDMQITKTQKVCPDFKLIPGPPMI